MDEYVEKIRLEKDAHEADEDTSVQPIKFKPVKWISWKHQLTNYLSQLKSLMHKLPLSYVIRSRTQPADVTDMDKEDQRFWTVRLSGDRFQKDNKKVWGILKSLLLDTDGWTWIEDHENNGRAAYQALSDHYDGPGQTEKRVAEARGILKQLHYKNERNQVNFEVYITCLKECFTILEDNGHGYQHDGDKVDIMLEKIDNDAPLAVQTAIINIRMNQDLQQDFVGASNKLSEVIAKSLSISTAATGPRGYQGRRVSEVRGGRGRGRGRFGGRGRGRGRGYSQGRQGGRGAPHASFPPNTTSVSGVDVTDPTRNFNREEYSKLIDAGYVPTLKERRREYYRTHPRANISAATTTSTNSNSATNDNVDDGPPSNGNRFGSGAYDRPTKRIKQD